MSDFEQNNPTFTSNKPYLFRAVYQWILDNDATPYLLVDATQVDVQVPREHVKDGQIVLNTSPSAIDNWFEDNEAISFSARFSGKAQTIYVPMTALLAVYAQENGMGMAFPDEVSSQFADGGEEGIEDDIEDSTNSANNVNVERTVETVSDNTNITSVKSKQKDEKKSRSHLKVIK